MKIVQVAFYFFFAILLTQFCHGQTIVREVFSPLGGVSKNDKFHVQYTAGQAAVVSSNVLLEDRLYVSEGFHRSKAGKWTVDDFTISGYPNPTTSRFNFQTSLPDYEKFEYVVFDIRGRLLYNGKAQGKEWVELSLDNEETGMYLLRVITRTKSVTFKINKING